MRFLLLLICFITYSCSSHQKNSMKASSYNEQRAEIKKMCQAATSLDKQSFNSKAARNLAVNQKLEQIAKTRETQNMVSSIPLQSKAERWSLFQMGAKKLGLDDFECPALEKFYTSNY